MQSKKLAWYGICLFTLILLIGYAAISFNNRYQYDDLGFSSLVRDDGLWGAFIKMYFTWETTYLTLLLFLQLKFVNQISPFVYNLAILLITSYCFFLVLRTILKRMEVHLTRREEIVFSALVILISYFSSRAMGNVTYWVTGQIVYCLFLSWLFLGVHFWIQQKYFLASVCLFLFGHTRINYDAIFIGLYGCFLFFDLWDRKRLIRNWRQHMPFFFFLLGMITYIIVPGNYHRSESFGVTNAISGLDPVLLVRRWFSAFSHLAGTILSSWRQMIVVPVGLLLGFYFSENSEIRRRLCWSFLFKCSVAFVVAYLGQATVLYIAIRTTVGYGRIFYLLELLLFLLMLLIGIFLGLRLKPVLSGWSNKLVLGTIILPLIFYSILYHHENWELTKAFARAYDSRVQFLLEQKNLGRTSDVEVPALPHSGVLQFMEIAQKPDKGQEIDGNNYAYRRFYKLPFHVFVASAKKQNVMGMKKWD